MVIYPQGLWHTPRAEDDIEEIVQSHFIEGRPVKRLIILPQI